MARKISSRVWRTWLRRWDVQQESYLPNRETRFRVMLDTIEATVGRSPRILDLGSGPGSLSLRILRRFPRAHCVAVDYDPVVLRIGQGALGSYRGRLRWVDTKIGVPGWTEDLPSGKFDAVVSTTALHWLSPEVLQKLYRDLGRLVRSNGVFLNGDYIPFGPTDPRIRRLVKRIHRLRLRSPERRAALGAWRRWWQEAARAPELAVSFREHRRRRAQHPHREKVLPVDAQIRVLRRAGFRTATVILQSFEDRILFAQR